MKKFLIIIVLILGLGGFYLYYFKPTELESLGYKESEIKTITLKCPTINTYDERIIKLLDIEDFSCSNINEYLDYNNEFKAPLEETVVLVNKGITTYYDENIINLIKEKYFIDNNLERYLSYLKKNDSKNIEDIVRDVNSNIDYEFYTNTIETNVLLDNLMIVNKYYKLDNDFEPDDLVIIDSDCYNGNPKKLSKVATEAFNEMCHASLKDGVIVKATSAYRSYATQKNLYNSYVNRDGVKAADTYSARAGYSEHQTGLAVDVNIVNETFANTKAYEWMIKNSYKYGYILRYPKGKEYITGYQYEPWHYRYVGKEVAKFIYENDLLYEEYYAYFVAK